MEAAILVILITQAAMPASHMLWQHEWWRRPFLWSDRWHILSFMSHWPAMIFICWHFINPIVEDGYVLLGYNTYMEVSILVLLIATAIMSSGLWQIMKTLTGRDWDSNFKQLRTWITSCFRGRV